MSQNKEKIRSSELEPRTIWRWQIVIRNLREEIKQRPKSEKDYAHLASNKRLIKLYGAALAGNPIAFQFACEHYLGKANIAAMEQYHFFMIGMFQSVFGQEVTLENRDALAERLVQVRLALYLGRLINQAEAKSLIAYAKEQIRAANEQRPTIKFSEVRANRAKKE